jgi:hypothetical protein
MKRVFVAGAAALSIAISAFGQTSGKVEIRLKNNDAREQQTKLQLERLLANYDLSRWMFTRTLLIESDVIPHSHPVLTLSTRHLKDDELLLSTFVHEQLHWFLVQRDKDTESALKEVRAMFPKVPVGGAEGGARDMQSTYLHLLVCSLEYMAVRELLGELRTKQVMEFWSGDHYNWIYKTVLERNRDIAKILFKYNLTPPRS